jgi:hypothetical protein
MPSNTTASPTAAEAMAAPVKIGSGKLDGRAGRQGLQVNPDRAGSRGIGQPPDRDHQKARPPRPVAVWIEPPITSRSASGSGRPAAAPSPSSTPWETPKASNAESRIAAHDATFTAGQRTKHAGAGLPSAAYTTASERW